MFRILLSTALFYISFSSLIAKELPNILWITAEDMSPTLDATVMPLQILRTSISWLVRAPSIHMLLHPHQFALLHAPASSTAFTLRLRVLTTCDPHFPSLIT